MDWVDRIQYCQKLKREEAPSVFSWAVQYEALRQVTLSTTDGKFVALRNYLLTKLNLDKDYWPRIFDNQRIIYTPGYRKRGFLAYVERLDKKVKTLAYLITLDYKVIEQRQILAQTVEIPKMGIQPMTYINNEVRIGHNKQAIILYLPCPELVKVVDHSFIYTFENYKLVQMIKNGNPVNFVFKWLLYLKKGLGYDLARLIIGHIVWYPHLPLVLLQLGKGQLLSSLIQQQPKYLTDIQGYDHQTILKTYQLGCLDKLEPYLKDNRKKMANLLLIYKPSLGTVATLLTKKLSLRSVQAYLEHV